MFFRCCKVVLPKPLQTLVALRVVAGFFPSPLRFHLPWASFIVTLLAHPGQSEERSKLVHAPHLMDNRITSVKAVETIFGSSWLLTMLSWANLFSSVDVLKR